jgi:Rps23 Pro-64 3,4-dihydroxylase Tpa1-like proline 4-hydroxylase
MSNAIEQATFSFDKAALDPFADRMQQTFESAKPFSYAMVDGLFPPEVLEAVLAEFPEPEQVPWQSFDQATEIKLALADTTKMGPATRNVLAECNGQVFIDFLERVTGITGLIPDPHYAGGGLHQIRRGGYLKVHADFNWHKRLRLDRRLNVLIYLNKDWDESYGGSLELWNRDMSAAEQIIPPIFNRLVVFATTSTAYHGHPEPLTCPPERARRSMALYYYTNGRPDGEVQESHSTLFQSRPGEKKVRLPKRDALRRWVPPPILDWLHARKR